MNPQKILVTGATGYVGGRLVPRLLEAGYQVRCLVRDPSRLEGREWIGRVEVVKGDVLQPESLGAAMAGIDLAYYMIHSMAEGRDFEERDRLAATHFSSAAKEAGVDRIIYLGGLGEPGKNLSPHLNSRQETAAALRSAGVSVTEFRAGVIVGSGSISFEMVRYLTERVPIMICPQWVYTRTQPIAIRSVLDYLVLAAAKPETRGQIVEIGGADVVTYGEMMTTYASIRGLRRLIVPVPVLTPRLSSYWVHLVTPIPAYIARPLIDGLKTEVIVRDAAAQRLFPEVTPFSYKKAVELALVKLDEGAVETAWDDALITSQGDVVPVRFDEKEGMLFERRQVVVEAPPEKVFHCFNRLGGDQGWLAMDWAWQVRGWADRLMGGVGLRRGRRDPSELRVGDAVDFWRVEAVETNRRLLFRAEMKLPGRAWLEFRVQGAEAGKSLLRITAFFAPKGLFGLLYWYAFLLPHLVIFPGMIRKLKTWAEKD